MDLGLQDPIFRHTTINHLNVPGCHSTLRLFAATSSQAPFSAHWEPAPWKRNCWLSPYPHTFRLRNASGAKHPNQVAQDIQGFHAFFGIKDASNRGWKTFLDWQADGRTAIRLDFLGTPGPGSKPGPTHQSFMIFFLSSRPTVVVGWWLRLSLCAKGRSQPSAKFQSFHGDPGDYDVRALSRKGCCEALVERQRPFLCVVWWWYPSGF